MRTSEVRANIARRLVRLICLTLQLFSSRTVAYLSSRSARLSPRVSACQLASVASLKLLIKGSVQALCFRATLHESPRCPSTAPSPQSRGLQEPECSRGEGACELEQRAERSGSASDSNRLSFPVRTKGYFCSLNKCHSKSDQTMSWRE